MRKQIVFNVGGGLSTYIENDGHTILIDIGKSSEFSPIENFLLPLFTERGVAKGKDDKYPLSQMILSHPHNDHIASIKEAHSSFYPSLMTVPNDNEGMPVAEKIKWQLIDNPTNDYVEYLRRSVLPGRKPPLVSIDISFLRIYYLKSLQCEKSPALEVKNYANNISIVAFLEINGSRVLVPGDLMKDGMSYLIKNYPAFRGEIEDGVDILLAPHHGLQSSFSTDLFASMKNGKTKRMNIVCEGPTSEDSDRVVDSRYSSTDYCDGINNLSTKEHLVCQRKTSNGHIIIDYSAPEPIFLIETSNDERDLIKHFLK